MLLRLHWQWISQVFRFKTWKMIFNWSDLDNWSSLMFFKLLLGWHLNFLCFSNFLGFHFLFMIILIDIYHFIRWNFSRRLSFHKFYAFALIKPYSFIKSALIEIKFFDMFFNVDDVSFKQGLISVYFTNTVFENYSSLNKFDFWGFLLFLFRFVDDFGFDNFLRFFIDKSIKTW